MLVCSFSLRRGCLLYTSDAADEIDKTMRSKNFNDALKKAINGNWSFAHIKLTYEEKRGPEPGYSVKLFQPTD